MKLCFFYLLIMRLISLTDRVLCELDSALRTIIPPKIRITERISPARDLIEPLLTKQDKKHSVGLMRVNHAGEVCAQALYQGQALTAQLTHIKQQMEQAAQEENDHLAWCEERLSELGSKTSLLNPLWYGGSLLLGILAGLAGDKVSLGFVAETEKQVISHLQHHLAQLPKNDEKTKLILEQMQEDEEHHARTAMQAGGIELPYLVQHLMACVAKLMTKSSYYL